MEPISLRTPLALLLSSLGMIAALWWWLATPIRLARAPIDPDAKLQCVSYAPFRGAQTPLLTMTRISPEQIEQDLAQLVKISECVRTYSIEAYDQPWKRQLEGTVGGYWGLLDSARRELKYPPGE